MSWMEKSEAKERMLEIVGRKTDDEALIGSCSRMADQIIEEICGWCGIELLPEGALWAAADELIARAERSGDASKITLGDYSVSFSESSRRKFHRALIPYRRLRF